MSADGFRLDDKVAIVTGGASGIGLAAARTLSAAGAGVALVDRDETGLADAAAQMQGGEAKTLTVAVDLRREESAEEIVAQVQSRFGRLDVLVHAAGAFLQDPFGEASRESLELQFEVNARAPFLLSQAALPHLRPGSSIVFISSIGAHVGWADCSVYCWTKGAIEGLSRALAVELAPAGIRVNAVAPGTTDTPMNEKMFSIPGMKQSILEKIPAGRIAAVEDIARPILFLASDASRHVVGQSLIVDGGYVAQ